MRLFDYSKVSRLMARADIELLLAHTKPNVEYLTDYQWATHWARDNFLTEDGRSCYASFVGLPRNEAAGPFYIGLSSEIGYPENYGMWIEDRRYWGAGFEVSGRSTQVPIASDIVPLLVEVVRSKQLHRGKIGLELNQIEMVYYEALRESLPDAIFVDAAPILWELRRVKHPDEIRRMREAAKLTSEVCELSYSSATAGMTERDLDALMARWMAARGLHYEWMHVGFGPKGANFVGATDTPLKPGEILRVDLGGSYKGYVCDMSRSLAFGGKVSDAARRAHAVIHQANQALRKALRPGVTGREMYRLCMQTIEDAGYRPLTRQAGHSVGRTVHELPCLNDENDSPLEPDMVLTIEPCLRVEDVGSINIEDLMLVTEDGAECLTPVPRELEAYL